MWYTHGQGFADALGRRNPEDGDPNMAIINQDTYEWKHYALNLAVKITN